MDESVSIRSRDEGRDAHSGDSPGERRDSRKLQSFRIDAAIELGQGVSRLRITHMESFLKSFCLVAVCVAGVTACGSSSTASGPANTATSAGSTTSAPLTSTSAGPTITISKDLKFSSVPVKAGATVTVRNDSAVEHTVSADTVAGGFDITMEAGKKMTFTAPSKPGAYGFHCNIHTFMKGTLEVT